MTKNKRVTKAQAVAAVFRSRCPISRGVKLRITKTGFARTCEAINKIPVSPENVGGPSPLCKTCLIRVAIAEGVDLGLLNGARELECVEFISEEELQEFIDQHPGCRRKNCDDDYYFWLHGATLPEDRRG